MEARTGGSRVPVRPPNLEPVRVWLLGGRLVALELFDEPVRPAPRLVFAGEQAVRHPVPRGRRVRRRGTVADDLRLLYAGATGQERGDRCPSRSLCLRRNYRLPAGF